LTQTIIKIKTLREKKKQFNKVGVVETTMKKLRSSISICWVNFFSSLKVKNQKKKMLERERIMYSEERDPR